MAETVKVTGGEQVNAYFAKIQEGITEWSDSPVYVGYNRKGSHGRLIEGGFHPRGGSTYVPGRHILEAAKQKALGEAKEAVLRSIEGGGGPALDAKRRLGNATASEVRSSVPVRRGGLRGSVVVIVGGTSRRRRR